MGGNLTKSTSHHKPKNRSYEPKRFRSLKGFLERKTAQLLPNLGGEPDGHRIQVRHQDISAPISHATNSNQPSSSQPSNSRPFRDERSNPEINRRDEPLKTETPKPSGTRGLFIPTYRSPEHFSQRRRPANPTLPFPATNRQLPRNESETIVRFFDCENLTYSRESITSPGLKRLISAAVAFLGERQLSDMPDAPQNANSGYRGLSLAASQGSYHLHFPDCASVRPFHGEISVDWESVKRIHRRDFPSRVLFVGVGLGEPGANCN